MLKEEIIKNNTLLAKFDANVLVNDTFFYCEKYGFYVCKYGDYYFQDTFNEDELLYHELDNWLMPVVRKCLLICHENMLNEWENAFSHAFMSGYFTLLYNETVEFVKFYNNNKNILNN